MDQKIDAILHRLYNNVSAQTLDSLPVEDLAGIIQAASCESLTIEACAKRVQQVRAYRTELARLRTAPLVAQRSDEWYELRKQRLTASDIAQAIGKGKFASRNQLLQKKIGEIQGKSAPFRAVAAMKWGVMFEPMAMRCYQRRNDNVNVYEFGLVPHPTLNCFGASPDGITELGVMTEIKCPFKRKITGDVPDYYELQMQGQLAVCCLEECDYIECDMQVFETTEEYYDACDEEEDDHGVICEFMHAGETKYEYSEAGLTPKQAYAWARECSTMKMRGDPEVNLIKIHTWKLRQISVQRIYFDRARWETELVPLVEAFWRDVQDGLSSSSPQSSSSTLDITTPSTIKKKYKFIQDDDD